MAESGDLLLVTAAGFLLPTAVFLELLALRLGEAPDAVSLSRRVADVDHVAALGRAAWAVTALATRLPLAGASAAALVALTAAFGPTLLAAAATLLALAALA
ncbi:MAG TPA: hypothetical protein DEA08_27410, partial [Planctomycetes bacterium]|nr:hypothetical protein [Planctomycetota bacterium]